jgi:hypothetical protein
MSISPDQAEHSTRLSEHSTRLIEHLTRPQQRPKRSNSFIWWDLEELWKTTNPFLMHLLILYLITGCAGFILSKNECA